ncbi:rhodanese-like domain-containing protein [Pseudomonas taetrolens]|uniref:rhodanese-like domain-containing protein n=1 Tax=Pseudomonas taetrolens TaxID=47884 RepID=UPI003BB7273B
MCSPLAYFLLDVRHGDEFEAGHLPGALNIELELSIMFDPGKALYADLTHCREPASIQSI